VSLNTVVQARLPWPVGVCKHRLNGRTPWEYYVWRLPDDADEQIHAHAKLFAACHRDIIPAMMTRQQDALVRDLSRNPALGVGRETVKFLIKSVVGVQPYRCNSKKQQRMELLASDPEAVADLADYIASGHDVTDMRFINGARDDPAFGPFISILVDVLEEHSQLAAHARRHHEGDGDGPVLRPTPLAASLPALIRKVKTKLLANPEHAAQLEYGTIKIPSEYALAARMQPTHRSRLSADWRTGTLPIKWAIQRRVLRKACPDAHYVNALGVNARHFVLELNKWDIDVLFVSDDDKCKVSIGQPELPQTAATRARRVLVGALPSTETGMCTVEVTVLYCSCACILPRAGKGMQTCLPLSLITVIELLSFAGSGEAVAALDHDFSGASATPSVKLLMKIPHGVDAVLPGSWYIGEVFVHIKDQVLQPSTPLRHAAELLAAMKAAGRLETKVRLAPVLWL
jgi:hypothetical protein